MIQEIEQSRKILYEVKELIGCHYYASRNDIEYPMASDLEEINVAIKKLQSLLNSGQCVPVSDTSKDASSGEAGNKNNNCPHHSLIDTGAGYWYCEGCGWYKKMVADTKNQNIGDSNPGKADWQALREKFFKEFTATWDYSPVMHTTYIEKPEIVFEWFKSQLEETITPDSNRGIGQAYESYINVLLDEINDLVGAASVHGWRSRNVERGEQARQEIQKLKNKGTETNLDVLAEKKLKVVFEKHYKDYYSFEFWVNNTEFGKDLLAAMKELYLNK
jgi:hypothetical protein